MRAKEIGKGHTYGQTGKHIKLKAEKAYVDEELWGYSRYASEDSISGVLLQTCHKTKKTAEGLWEGLHFQNFSTGDSLLLHLPGGGGVTMEMIYCASGSFLMGSELSEVGRDCDEVLHKVTLTKGFWLGKYPVTQLQWRNVMGTSKPESLLWRQKSGINANSAIRGVTWQECQEFCKKINSKRFCGARLPTEAEWEYACRAGTTGEYAGTGNLGEMGCYGMEMHADDYRPRIVGTKKPNYWGFFDMHGTVFERCSDWYGDYQSGNTIDPVGPETGELRVVRGGCVHSEANHCRSAFRGNLSDFEGDAPTRNWEVGFRLCCSV